MSKKEQMFALVEQWRESGLTRKSFANQHGFESESFNYWCKKQYNEVLKTDPPINISPNPQVSLPGFVELTSGLEVNAQIQPVRMELELTGGVRIKIY
ncbi:MAG: hypothetical protein Q8S54_05155 [Bacteroidota bacterium]|nr:hypothetical protein [Bacteroidota bacterium]